MQEQRPQPLRPEAAEADLARQQAMLARLLERSEGALFSLARANLSWSVDRPPPPAAPSASAAAVPASYAAELAARQAAMAGRFSAWPLGASLLPVSAAALPPPALPPQVRSCAALLGRVLVPSPPCPLFLVRPESILSCKARLPAPSCCRCAWVVYW